MFDVSYKYVARLAAAAKSASPDQSLLGGAAVTTAWDAILQDQPFVDALCYSEGELALADLLTPTILKNNCSRTPGLPANRSRRAESRRQSKSKT